jgi:hypothetical protein
MNMQKLSIAAAALSLLFLAGVSRSAAAEAPVASARELARTVDSALAGVARAAADPKQGLDRRNTKVSSFLDALAAMRSRVGQIEGALDRRDGGLFLLVDQGSTDLGELRVDWARTGARNDGITKGMRTASASYRTLRSTYGREGVRQLQGAALSEAEKRQLQRLQGTEQRFAGNLQRLRDEARRQQDAVTAAELERFRQEAVETAAAAADLATYLNALIATSELRGEWSADAPYVRKVALPQDWAAADETVQDLYVDSDIGQVFTIDLGKTAAGPPGPVQAGQPSPGGPGPAGEAAADPAAPAQSEEIGGEPVQAIEVAPAVDPASVPPADGSAGEEDATVEDTAGAAPAEAVEAVPPVAAEPDHPAKAPEASPKKPTKPPVESAGPIAGTRPPSSPIG